MRLADIFLVAASPVSLRLFVLDIAGAGTATPPAAHRVRKYASRARVEKLPPSWSTRRGVSGHFFPVKLYGVSFQNARGIDSLVVRTYYGICPGSASVN